MFTTQHIKKFAKQRPAPGERIEHGDADHPGFRVRVTDGGIVSYAFRYKLAGRSQIMTLGRHPAMSLADARKAWGEAREALREGRDPKVKRRTAQADGTVTALIETFRTEEVPKLAKGTADHMRADLDRLVDAIGFMQARAVEREHVQPIVNDARQRGQSAQLTTYKNCRRFFAWLLEINSIKSSPFEGMPPPSGYDPRERALKDSELLQVWRACEQIGGHQGAAVQLIIATAFRRDESFYLRWSEVESDKIVISGSRTKNREPNELPITTTMRSILDRMPRGKGFVFGDSGVGNHSQLKAKIDNLTPDLPHWTFHDLRRSVSTWLANADANYMWTKALLNHVSGKGHSDLDKAYQRREKAVAAAKALAVWEAHLQSLLGETRAAAA